MKLSISPEISVRTDGNCTTPPSSLYGSRDDLASLWTIDTELVGTPQTTSSEKKPWTKTKSSTHVSKKIGSKQQKWTWFYRQHGYMEKSYFTKNSREIGLHNFIEIWIFQTHKSKLPFGCGLKRHWLPQKNDGWKLELQMFTIDQSRKKPILVISFSDLPRADVC